MTARGRGGPTSRGEQQPGCLMPATTVTATGTDMDPELFVATGTVIDPEFTAVHEPTACFTDAMGRVMDPSPLGGSCLELDCIGPPLDTIGGRFMEPPAPAQGITTALDPSWHNTDLGVLPCGLKTTLGGACGLSTSTAANVGAAAPGLSNEGRSEQRGLIDLITWGLGGFTWGCATRWSCDEEAGRF